MLDPEKEREYREEAARLAPLPVEDQQTIVSLHRAVASDRKVSRANREEARKRAEALERYLGLKPKKREKRM